MLELKPLIRSQKPIKHRCCLASSLVQKSRECSSPSNRHRQNVEPTHLEHGRYNEGLEFKQGNLPVHVQKSITASVDVFTEEFLAQNLRKHICLRKKRSNAPYESCRGAPVLLFVWMSHGCVCRQELCVLHITRPSPKNIEERWLCRTNAVHFFNKCRQWSEQFVPVQRVQRR